jgi:hypothetical protein
MRQAPRWNVQNNRSHFRMAADSGKRRPHAGDRAVDGADERDFHLVPWAALAAALLGVLNLVRAGRPQDRTVALITTIGTACWAGLALAFGFSIHNVLERECAGARPLIHFLVSVVLVVFGILTLRRDQSAS